MHHDTRILVVDDDDAIRALLCTVLRRRGMKTDAARNGVEAMGQLDVHHYSIVLLDLMMPLMSGYEVLERLATRPLAMRPLVLVLTAGLEPRTFDTSLVVGTIHKPFDVELLVDTIAGCLNSLQELPQIPGGDDETAAEKTN